MHETRMRLTGVVDGIPFEHELLTMFVRNQLNIALALPFLACVTGATLLLWYPSWLVILWVCSIFISQGIQLALCGMFVRNDPRQTDVAEWGRRLAASEFLLGISWASVIYWFDIVDSDGGKVFLAALLLVVVSIRMVLASSFKLIVLAGTVPITFAIVLESFLRGDTLQWVMTLIVITSELTFLQLAGRLQETARHMLDLRAQKDALIAELEQAKSNSDAARRRAEEASAAKSRFLATMSHELRTPLNAILGFSEILKTEMLGAHAVAAYKEYAGDIHQSGEHLLKLINEILDLSRIEAGKFELREEPLSIAAVGSECRRLLDLRARERGITLAEDYQSDLPMVLADERAIRQIWLNLISNAIKFTPAGGEVTLSAVRTASGSLKFAVRDTGPGIAPDEIPQVMSPFGQGSNSRDETQEGIGLGLPIVHGLAQLHDGVFELKSYPGEGTEASVELPASRIVHAAVPARPVAMAVNA
ncbi:MAG TPA: ATP-binding protein [Woeseiaceae bacterium]|nr:ATP-binding protein [Woeseiaceae bacterium]